MKSRIIIGIVFSVYSLSGLSQENEILTLEDTYQKWIKAWNDRDAKTVAEISWQNYGFGRDVPFLRNGAKDLESYEEGILRYMESMAKIEYSVYFTNFKIIDSVGLIDGYYAQTTQQINSLIRTVYGRQSLVFLKVDGSWKLIHYHRSQLPDEFIR